MDLTSKSIGLALSGGGSKEIAHVGVLKFLIEQGINPSCTWVKVLVPFWELCTRLVKTQKKL